MKKIDKESRGNRQSKSRGRDQLQLGIKRRTRTRKIVSRRGNLGGTEIVGEQVWEEEGGEEKWDEDEHEQLPRENMNKDS